MLAKVASLQPLSRTDVLSIVVLPSRIDSRKRTLKKIVLTRI